MVRPIVNRFKDANDVAKQVAHDLYNFVAHLLQTQNRVDIAITGGTVGIASLAEAAQLPFNDLDLEKLHIWWGDERFVDNASADRNAVQASNAWLNKLPIPAANIHEFPAKTEGLTLDEAARRFDSEFSANPVVFDLMLMGMGPDGHVASLFPGQESVTAKGPVLAVHNSPKPPAERLSFTYATINNALEIWFTVAGADKAEAVSTVFGDEPQRLPAGRISGKEKTVWYIDQTAGNLVWGC